MKKSMILIVISLLILSILTVPGQDLQENNQMKDVSIVGDDELSELAERENWTGSGTEDDPYYIQNYTFINEWNNFCLRFKYITSHVVIKNCSFDRDDKKSADGISIIKSSNISIIDNTFLRTKADFNLKYSSDIEIIGNELQSRSEKTGVCMKIADSDHVDVVNNNIPERCYDTINIGGSDHVKIENNRGFNSSQDSINLYDSRYVNISNNTINRGILDIDHDNKGMWNTLQVDNNTLADGEIVLLTDLKNKEIDDRFGQLILFNCTGVDITSPTLDDGSFKTNVEIVYSKDVSIKDQDVVNKDVFVIQSEDIDIGDNRFKGSKVVVQFSNKIRIYKNQLTGEGGLFFSNHKDCLVKNNELTGNKSWEQNAGIYVYMCRGNTTIKDNKIRSYLYGIRVHSDSKHIVIDNNEIEDIDKKGIYLRSSTHVNIRNNNISDVGGEGIDIFESKAYLYGSETKININISKNHLTDIGQRGLIIRESWHINAENNMIADCGSDGIKLLRSRDSKIESNEISGCRDEGLEIDRSSSSTISENVLYDNSLGMMIYRGENNIVKNNSLVRNEQSIKIRSLSDSSVCGNNFIQNELGAEAINIEYCNDSYPVGGNFWSRHNYSDLYRGPGQNESGSDGIVDEPFYISDDCKDMYPLTVPTVDLISFDDTPPSIDVDYKENIYTGKEVHFDASSTEDENGVFSFRWDINGTMIDGEDITYTFDEAGDFTIELRVADIYGNIANWTTNIEVKRSEPPTADAGRSITVREGNVVNFDGYNSMDNLKIVNYTWTFQYSEEEIKLYGPAPEFKFDEPGSYNVTLTVKDEEGNVDQDHMKVEVEKKETPGFILPSFLILLVLTSLYIHGKKGFDG